MPTLSQEDVIKEYWEKNKEKYPNMEFAEFQRICKSPFLHFKEEIRGTSYPTILIKHIGKIKVFPAVLKEQLNALENFKRTNTIEPDVYETRKSFLSRLLDKVLKQEPHGNKKVKDEEDTDDTDRES